jgi:uncharacterized membrane protein
MHLERFEKGDRMPDTPNPPENPQEGNGTPEGETRPTEPGEPGADENTYKAPPPPPPSGASEPKADDYVSPNRTIMIVLAYLGILALIPLLAENDDQEVQWHAKHGLVLMVAWIVISVVLTFAWGIPILGMVFGCGLVLLPLVILGFHVYLILQALQGTRVNVPLITDFANQWK